MLSFILGKFTGVSWIKYALIGSVVAGLLSAGGYVVYKYKSMEAKVTELSVANSSLIEDNNRYINYNRSLTLEIAAAYESRKAVDELVGNLQRNVSTLNNKSNEASNEIINYRKAPGVTKCTVSREWLSIYKNITDTVNTTSDGLQGGGPSGAKGSNTKSN